MATMGEILIKDESGDVIQGPRENGSSFIYEFKAEVSLLVDSSSIAIGRRRVEVFWIVKNIDEITTDLLSIVANNRECKEIKVTLYRIGAETGLHEPYFSYTFSDARIVAISNWMNSVYDPTGAENPHFERIGIVAREITWEHIVAAKTTMIPQWGSGQ
jgi:type VI secretion system Hcp family effector